MRLERGDPAYLFDMLIAARAVVRMAAGKSRQDFEQDETLSSGLERKLGIIGEAACRVSKQFRATHTHVPWQKIMATRHILVHDYDAVNPNTVWLIVTTHVPELIGQLEALLPPPPVDPFPE